MHVGYSNRKKHRRHSGSKKRGPRYWVISIGTLGAIIAFTAGTSRAMNVRYAEIDGSQPLAVQLQSHVREIIDFDIQPGPLRSALEKFEKMSGIRVTVDNDRLLDLQTKGFTGSFSVETGLQKLLAGTGISYVFLDAKSVLLFLKADSATVEIKAADTGKIDSPKYDRPLRDIPQTINIVPKELIEQQGASTLRDVLGNVPGITMTAGEGGAPAGDNLSIRGFSARNDIFVDGVRDLGPQSRDPFDLEQVEIIKGPSSVFTGRGSTGGTVNLVSKLPNLRRSFSGNLSAGTADTRRATADVNLPFGRNTAFRLNLMGHDSNFPGREVVSNRRWGAAPSVMFGLGTSTRFSASYYYIDQSNISDYGIPWVPAANSALPGDRDRPAPVPRSTFYGFLGRDHEKLRSDLATGRYEHEFNDKTAVRTQARYGYSRRDSIATPPRFANNSTTEINREMRSWLTNDEILDSQTDITTSFKTGSITHSIVFGGSYALEKNQRVLRTAPNAVTTLLNPDPNDTYAGTITLDPRRPEARAHTVAGYFFDSIKLNRRWEVVGGIRWDRFAVEGENAATVGGQPVMISIDRVDTILSGRASVIFRPADEGNIYFSFGSSADPSLEGLLYSPGDVRTDTEKTRTFELGSKWELLDGRINVAGSLFRVEKTNARTPGLTAGDPPTLDGDQRVQGLEFSATANIGEFLHFLAGYAFLDSEIIDSNTPPTIVGGVAISEVGKSLINTPRHSFNLWATFSKGRLFLGGGPRFVSKRFGNNINTREVEGYVTVDSVLTYRLTKRLDIRINANNLTDKYFIDRIGGGHILPGAGRSLILSTAFRF